MNIDDAQRLSWLFTLLAEQRQEMRKNKLVIRKKFGLLAVLLKWKFFYINISFGSEKYFAIAFDVLFFCSFVFAFMG